MLTSGRAPTRSRAARSGSPSNSRGTIETGTPSCWRRCKESSSTSGGEREKLMIACSTPCSGTTRSRLEISPRIGTSKSSRYPRRAPFKKPTGRSPISGLASSRVASSRPTRPAPMMRVRRPPPCLRRDLVSATVTAACPAVRKAATKNHSRSPCDPGTSSAVKEDAGEGNRHHRKRRRGHDVASVIEEPGTDARPVHAGGAPGARAC